MPGRGLFIVGVELMTPPPIMALPDGAQVCDWPDHGCLIAYGDGRRMEAVQALVGLA